MSTALAIDGLERRLLDECQRGVPLDERPYAAIAQKLGATEAQVIAALARLVERGYASRVGPVFRPGRCGASTLAAMAVPSERLDEVAATVSARPEVNHNYEREHTLNLWFVATAPDRDGVARALDEIAAVTGIDVLDLPLEADYHIDLGFPLSWTA